MFPDAPPRPLPPARPRRPAGPAPARPPGPAGPSGPTRPTPVRPRRPRPPSRDPRLALVHAFAALWLEAEAGRRSPAQLYGLMDARLVARLVGGWRPACDGVAGRVRAVSGTQTAPGRFDAVAVVQRGDRASALALRLVRDAEGWKVTEVVRPGLPTA